MHIVPPTRPSFSYATLFQNQSGSRGSNGKNTETHCYSMVIITMNTAFWSLEVKTLTVNFYPIIQFPAYDSKFCQLTLHCFNAIAFFDTLIGNSNDASRDTVGFV